MKPPYTRKPDIPPAKDDTQETPAVGSKQWNKEVASYDNGKRFAETLMDAVDSEVFNLTPADREAVKQFIRESKGGKK